jgi:hypothetical protein
MCIVFPACVYDANGKANERHRVTLYSSSTTPVRHFSDGNSAIARKSYDAKNRIRYDVNVELNN